MAKRNKKLGSGRSVWIVPLGLIGLSLIVAILLRDNDVILFNPKGLVANEQHKLMVQSTLIMLVIAIPTLFLLYFFAWKYRETNHNATYHPASKHRKLSTLTIWAIPTTFMVILASIMLPATQKLEPQKSIEAENETLKIQVVALRWKWLFIYPEQNIATVNYAQIPVDTPVEFELTADETPMSSFWIPHLGGMLYAMTEHVNRLNLIADTVGDYDGSAAEINGHGFAGMRFTARVSSQYDFDQWVFETRNKNSELSTEEYKKLLTPSENYPPTYFGSRDPDIYTQILSKYAGGSHQHNTEYGGHE